MTIGDRVIYFRPARNSMGAYTKMDAHIVKLCKTQAIIMLLNGEKKRVLKENIEKVK